MPTIYYLLIDISSIIAPTPSSLEVMPYLPLFIKNNVQILITNVSTLIAIRERTKQIPAKKFALFLVGRLDNIIKILD